MRIGAASSCLLLLLWLALSPCGAAAGEDGALRDRVAGWVEDLRAPDFATREAARQALEAEAADAADLLEAYRDDPDPEVRRTVRLLLERVGRPPTVEVVPARDLRGVGVVRLVGEGRARDLFDALGAAHGARVELPADFDAEAPLDVTLAGDVPFFAALRALGDRAGLVPGDAFDRAGRIAMVRPGGPQRPWSAAGPMQVRVAEVTTTRVLPPDASRRFAIGLDLEWSPAVQLVTYTLPRDVEATDPEGRAYLPGAAMRTRTTYGVSSNTTRARVNVHLEPESEENQPALASLAFDLPLRLRHERHELVFPASAAFPQTLAEEVRGRETGARVTVEALEAPEAPRGPWTVRLVAELEGPTPTHSLEILLERPDGSLQPAHAGSRFPSADGRLELTARGYGLGEEAPVAVRVRWFGREEEGTLPFRLVDIPLR